MVSVGPRAVGPVAGSAVTDGAPGVASVMTRDAGQLTSFDLRGGFDAYSAGLSRNERSNHRRSLNKLLRVPGFHIEIVGAADVDVRFNEFVRMHQTQWKLDGRQGHFGDWPRALDFHRQLSDAFASSGRLRLVRLAAGDTSVAYYYCIRFGRRLVWRLSARHADSAWDAYALGRVGLLETLRVAAEEGVDEVDAGVGHYEYKRRLSGIETPLQSEMYVRDSRRSRISVRLAGTVSDLVNLLYYRAWYVRIRPRMLGKGRPLWPYWIRTRF